MRTEKEMLDLIINTAKEDERIRAVIMNGSRANPSVPKDIFQDYDICYIVEDVAPFFNNKEYIKRFGELLMLQMPETMRGAENDGNFAYLMQFADGNRIDLSFTSEKYEDDGEPASVLLDKDNDLPSVGTDDKIYHVKSPTENDYFSCCNDFWWCSMNVAKGIWRDELPYAMEMYNDVVRKELHSMIDWYVGMKNNFAVSVGKSGKYYKNYLSEKQYEMYRATFSGADYDYVWKSLFKAGDLFRSVALGVGVHFGFTYLHEDDRRVCAYLKHVQKLPKDAKEVY
ncbi:MAG: aminoglycoside 6-adenylyltransferase [Oscillospiraceae bacterium]|jgi:aminoglycoside 6-adenylyltransferase|nr:aminoglycoside 6-adenylyltransferase [Oscillospiraceae bacterium]